ncbi:MAG: hypothetical protein PHT76_12005 [Anaerostipes sp.]|nr:hypothetical protein [Anaerostipes sp.]
MTDSNEEKKRYQRNLIILFPFCVLLELLTVYAIGNVDVIPVWLQGIGGFFGALIGGPLFGGLVLVAFTIIELMVHFELIHVFIILPTIAAIISFGFVTRMGFFKNLKGVALTVTAVAFVRTMTTTPVLIGVSGGHVSNNDFAESLFVGIWHAGLSVPFATMLSTLIAYFIDCGIIVMISYFVLRIFWNFWDRNFDVKVVEAIKIQVVEEKDLDE